MQPIDVLAIAAAAKKEAGKAIKDALPVIADMVRREVDAKEVKTIADTAITIKGDKGDNGDKGLDGKDGRDGKDGINGRDGKDGASGKDGKDGKDGIAKDGKDGRNGKDGRDGKDGVGVSEVAIGDDGHLYVGLSNGSVVDAGKARGDEGKPGKDGKTIIGGGGGSSRSAAPAQVGSSGTAVLDFGNTPGTNVIVATVTGQSAITASANIKAWFAASGTLDHNAYEHAVIFPNRIGLACGDIVEGVGFSIYASTELRLTGDVVCRWEWS